MGIADNSGKLATYSLVRRSVPTGGGLMMRLPCLWVGGEMMEIRLRRDTRRRRIKYWRKTPFGVCQGAQPSGLRMNLPHCSWFKSTQKFWISIGQREMVTETSEVYDLFCCRAGVNFDTEACSYLAPKPAVNMTDGSRALDTSLSPQNKYLEAEHLHCLPKNGD